MAHADGASSLHITFLQAASWYDQSLYVSVLRRCHNTTSATLAVNSGYSLQMTTSVNSCFCLQRWPSSLQFVEGLACQP